MHIEKVHNKMNCRLLHCQMQLRRKQDEGNRNMIDKQSIGTALVALCESLQISCQNGSLERCSQLLVHSFTYLSIEHVSSPGVRHPVCAAH